MDHRDLTKLTYYTARLFMIRCTYVSAYGIYEGSYVKWCTGVLLLNVGPFAKETEVGITIKGDEVTLYELDKWETPIYRFHIPPQSPFPTKLL